MGFVRDTKSKYTHLFVDEYQDSSQEQHEIFLAIQSLGVTTVAVGDPAQSIFGFSGKDSKYLTSLASNSEFTLFPLNYNHRCHESIVAYSRKFLDHDAKIEECRQKRVLELRLTGNESSLSRWVDENIAALCLGLDIDKRSDVAILVKNSSSAKIISESLKSKNRLSVPHPLEEGQGQWGSLFYGLLRYVLNPKVAAQSVVDEFRPPGMTEAEERKYRLSVQSLISKEPVEVEDFIRIAQEYFPRSESKRAVDVLRESLKDPQKEYLFSDMKDDEINIMTLHKSKGMEFDLVIHADLVTFVLPFLTKDTEGRWVHEDLQQDKNLHYVGITRAKKCLILVTHTIRTNSAGAEKLTEPSEFLSCNGVDRMRGIIQG